MLFIPPSLYPTSDDNELDRNQTINWLNNKDSLNRTVFFWIILTMFEIIPIIALLPLYLYFPSLIGQFLITNLFTSLDFLVIYYIFLRSFKIKNTVDLDLYLAKLVEPNDLNITSAVKAMKLNLFNYDALNKLNWVYFLNEVKTKQTIIEHKNKLLIYLYQNWHSRTWKQIINYLPFWSNIMLIISIFKIKKFCKLQFKYWKELKY